MKMEYLVVKTTVMQETLRRETQWEEVDYILTIVSERFMFRVYSVISSLYSTVNQADKYGV